MFEPFIWMFKTEGFKTHYIKILITSIILFVAGIISTFPTVFLGTALFVFNPILSIIIFALGIFLACSSFFMVQGYFWELTEQIIDRTCDIKSASIYNGKISQVYTIVLPEWNVLKMIWRGFASIVATIIMYIPWGILIYTCLLAQQKTAIDFANRLSLISVEPTLWIPMELLLLIFIFLIPGLLWNYANRNSVVATLNIRKAIYIFGNYPLKYILNLLAMALFYFVDMGLTLGLIKLFHIDSLAQSSNHILAGILLLLFSTFVFIKFLYKIFVYAYLIGTLAPSGEG